jgi:hypothetical protein
MAAIAPRGPPDFASPTNAAFGSSIQALVKELERDANPTHSIPRFCRQFAVKRRRLYDVVNVFTAVGCANRKGTDEIEWFGRQAAVPRLTEICKEKDIHNYSKTLCELFPPDKCVGLPSLTHSFVLLFGAIHLKTLDLRGVSSFLSRNTSRYKSTLCKLYQITLVLGALGIVERTTNVCEVEIQSPFDEVLAEIGPMSLGALLNRPARGEDPISKRRVEYGEWSKKRPRGGDRGSRSDSL